jgi:hypothetical protein
VILKLNKINDLARFDKKTFENISFLLFFKNLQKPKQTAVSRVFQNKNIFSFFLNRKNINKHFRLLKKKKGWLLYSARAVPPPTHLLDSLACPLCP